MELCILTTSYPRHAADDAGIFVKRLVEALSSEGATGAVVVPRDADEPTIELQQGFRVRRFHYGWPKHGGLAFGAGILPNLKSKPWLIFQAPGLILAMSRAAAAEQSARLLHANWLIAGLSAYLCARKNRKPYVITLR